MYKSGFKLYEIVKVTITKSADKHMVNMFISVAGRYKR
jgi:hypothetical protein